MGPRIQSGLALAALLLAGGCSSPGDDAPPLFSVVDDAAGTSAPVLRAVAGAASASRIQIDAELVKANPPLLRVSLPTGALTAQRVRFAQRNGVTSWVADLRDQERPRGRIQVIAHDGGVSAIVSDQERRYEIHPRDARSGYLYAIDARKTPGCATDSAGGAAPPVAPKAAGLQANNAKVTLDVVALYTDAFLADPGSEAAVRGFIDASVTIANDVFAQSDIPAVYRLVYKGPLTGPQPAASPAGGTLELQRVRDWMTAAKPPEELQALRDSYGGDLLALFIPLGENPGACGVSFINSQREPFNQRAFSVHRSGCGLGDYTFAHELGHNLGMFHDDRDRDNSGALYAFAAGKIFDDASDPQKKRKLATVMECASEGGKDISQAVCNRVGIFSDPNLDWLGQPVGDATHNNAEVARLQVPSYADHRPEATSAVPVVRIVAPARGARMVQGRLSATATAQDQEDGDLSKQLRWSSDLQGPLGVGAQLEVALSTVGRHLITAQVTDSAGRTGRWSVPVEVSPLPLPRFTSTCRGLSCTLDARASSGEVPISAYEWQLPGGARATGSQTVAFLPGYAAHNVTLRVVDQAGQSATLTQLVQPLLPQAPISPRAGMFYNPARSGNGIDFFMNSTNQWVLSWYTYETNGEPVWYLTDIARLADDGANWSAPLLRYTWNGKSSSYSIVGKASLAFSDAATAWFSWTLNGAAGGERFEFLFGGEAPSGLWFDPKEPGWGFALKQQNGLLLATTTLYIGGQPRWVQGQVPGGDDVTIPMAYLTDPGLCPTCTGGSRRRIDPAGTMRVRIAGRASVGQCSLAVTMPGETWIRNLTDIAVLTVP